MEATAVFCDYAQVHAGKLSMIGAGANLIFTLSAEPPHLINCAVGVLVEIPWNAHNHPHRLKISLVSEDGVKVAIAQALHGQPVDDEDVGSIVAQFNAGRSPLMQAGDDSLMPIAIPLSLGVPSLGGYSVVVELDGTEAARAKFRVLHVSQFPGASPIG